jgi:hypothetical protein
MLEVSTHRPLRRCWKKGFGRSKLLSKKMIMQIAKVFVVVLFLIVIPTIGFTQNALFCPVHNMKFVSDKFSADSIFSSLPILRVMSDKKEVYSLIEGIVEKISKNGNSLVIRSSDSSYYVNLYSFDSIIVHQGDRLKPGAYLGNMIKVDTNVFVLKIYYSNDDSIINFRRRLADCETLK